MARIYLATLVCCLLALAGTRFFAEQPETQKELHIYLLIGGSNMAGRAEIPDNARGAIDHALLLNAKNEWEPASEPLNRHSTVGKDADLLMQGPGRGFALAMHENDPSIQIGLIANAASGTKIADWLGKSKFYWGARGRSRAAMAHGTLKGVLWIHGEEAEENPEAYAGKLQALISNLRADLNNSNLPYLIGQVPGNPDLNAHLATLTEAVHATALISADELTNAANQHSLGKRFAEQMIQVQANLPPAPKPPADIRFIDPHVHAMSVTPLGLRAVALWMDDRNVERCIVSPLNQKGSRPQNEEERLVMLENFRPYKGRIDWMTLIEPQEVETVEEAVAILKRDIADGAIAFGEHYGKGLMFDDPKNLLLYEACQKVGLPVMFHIDQNKNMVEPGMDRVDRVLKMFPGCTIVAHAYWWRQLQHADRQLQEHPNLYADMSGAVVVNVLNRDREYAREFIIRNQDKLLWATDEGWWSFGSRDKQMNQHYTFFEELELPDEVRHKIYRENTKKVYRMK